MNRCIRKVNKRKGFAQTDYIIAVGIFILIFALVVQYVSNYFSSTGDTINIPVMNSQATSLLDIIERGYEPASWPYFNPNQSVVLMLHLDNSTVDSGIYGNDGTISCANCSAAVAGRLDTACSFDGINDYIDTASSGLGEENASFTVAAWINVASSTPSWKTIIDENVCSGFDFAVNSLNLRAGRNCGGGTLYNPSIAISANTWYHVAITYVSGNLSFYFDGLFRKSVSDTNTYILGGSFCIGSYNCAGAENFNGTIDEVIVWNRSLDESEVYSLWAYENILDRIGLSTKAYRFNLVVNNSQGYWKNQSLAVENIGNELVSINFTEIGFGTNIPSVAVYEDNGSSVGYQINGNTISFRTAINTNSAKRFIVYFDDDSNFMEQTQSISGVDNLTEIIEPVQVLPLIQYRKLLALNNSNYTRVKNSTQLPRDFGIRIVDVNSSSTIMSFGPPVPPSGNIVSFRRNSPYKNSTGSVRNARMTIQVW